MLFGKKGMGKKDRDKRKKRNYEKNPRKNWGLN